MKIILPINTLVNKLVKNGKQNNFTNVIRYFVSSVCGKLKLGKSVCSEIKVIQDLS